MKNKKGFTIIELVMGIGLLSIVTVFMLVVIVDLRNTETASGIDTKALLTQAIVSAAINRDLNRYSIDEDGIVDKTSEESTDEVELTGIPNVWKKIVFSFGSGQDKMLVLYNKIADQNKATSIFYGENSGNVDFKRTLPDGYYFTGVEITTLEGTKYKKITINVKSDTNSDLDYTIEAYFYPTILERESK